MSGKVSLVIELSTEERDRLEALAHKRGYDAVGDYLLALVVSDTEVEDLSKDQLLENLTLGLKEALRGETHPINTLWESLDDK